MKRKYRIIPLILALTILLATGCGKKEDEEIEEIIKPVVTQKAVMEEHSTDMDISGNVKPGQVVKVAFKVPGLIENINVNEGDKVSKGQVLMNLNTHDYEIALMSAQSQYHSIELEAGSKISSAVDQAEANLDFVNTQLERVRRLHEKGAVATKTVEEIELQKTIIEKKLKEAQDARETAQSQLAQAQSLIDLANSKLDDTVLHSPMDGTVVKKLSEPGETAIPGYPTIVIGKLNSLDVEIGVPDRMITSVEVGKKVKVSVKGLGKEVEGTISRIDPVADLETRTFPVIVRVDNKDGDIMPGMIANVLIEMDKIQAITLPIDAIIDSAEGTFIYVYDEESKKVTKREVETGQVFGDLIEIKSGIEDGENIVVEGQYRLNDGEEVNVTKTRGEEND